MMDLTKNKKKIPKMILETEEIPIMKKGGKKYKANKKIFKKNNKK
jgi:cell fate (sporulation/competence/biofilm development) regulator YmcA (YheA/YmcA/DUF963 family)